VLQGGFSCRLLVVVQIPLYLYAYAFMHLEYNNICFPMYCKATLADNIEDEGLVPQGFGAIREWAPKLSASHVSC
jgi:hypothetical protein